MDRLHPAFSKAVREEVPKWLAQDLITEPNAERLLSLYPIPDSQNQFVTILSIFGSVLVGLGVLLFVGANWDQISAALKLAIIVMTMVVSNYLGYDLALKQKTHSKVGHSLFLLGGLVYGAGIWLISQAYNLELDPSTGLALWSVGLIPLAVLTRSVPLAILNSLVTLFWCFMPHSLIAYVVAFAASIYLAYFSKSRLAVAICLLQGFTWQFDPAKGLSGTLDPLISIMDWASVISWDAALFAGFVWHWKANRLFANAYLLVFALTSFPVLLVATNSHYWSSSRSIPYLQLILAVATTLAVGFKFKEFARDLSFALVLCAMTFATLSFDASGLVPSFIVHLLFIAASVGMIYAGARQFGSTLMINIGIVFFALFVVFKYFDGFFAMLDRSLFFVLGGMTLIMGGYMLERQRRSLIRSIAQ